MLGKKSSGRARSIKIVSIAVLVTAVLWARFNGDIAWVHTFNHYIDVAGVVIVGLAVVMGGMAAISILTGAPLP